MGKITKMMIIVQHYDTYNLSRQTYVMPFIYSVIGKALSIDQTLGLT